MDAPLTSPDALVRPWRTATLVASFVAAIELVLLIGAAVMLLAKPLAHAVQRREQQRNRAGLNFSAGEFTLEHHDGQVGLCAR